MRTDPTGRRSQAGTTLIETTWSLLICVVILLTAVTFIASSFQGTRHNRDKAFGVQKAIAILEELKGLVERKSGGNINLLDGYDDGATQNPVLTTQAGITDPGHATSGNVVTSGSWRYERQVSVSKIPSLQTNDIRLVNVKVFANESDGEKVLLAEVAGVIRTIADQYPPTQVYDVYCIAAAQVPGWWVYMANLVPFVQNAIQDLQARNPGLEFRTHWIRALSYGRDQEYVPYINNAVASTSDIDWVYFYPGQMPSGSAVNYYYVPTLFKGRISIDGTVANDYDASVNRVPYAIADHFNNSMRYADELALWQRRVAAGLESEPTFRLLLDDMYLNPDRYENAIVINLHGELLPFPPTRNVSDAAKDPEDNPNVRVVTHPERLRYDNADNVRLRVYSYLADPAAAGGPAQLAEPIAVVVRGVSAASTAQVQSIEGGLDLNPIDGVDDTYQLESGDTASSYTGDMYFTAADVTIDGTPSTLFRLYNSPLKSPCIGAGCSGGGLTSGKRLYGTEYIPTPLPVGSGVDTFARNLTDTGDRTKNTARWVITIPAAQFTDNAVWTIETRIGDDLTTGSMWPVKNEPHNLSRTYTWRGTSLWAWGDATTPGHVPLTERFQMIGDPRHSPYTDVKSSFDVNNNPVGGGYNRYFDNLQNAAQDATTSDWWPGFTTAGQQVRDGWAGKARLEIDGNRLFQVTRSALLKTNAIWTTMTGFSYFYVGIGNEIGYDADNGFSSSIPVSTKPFTGVSGSMYEQSITDSVRMVKENVATNYWWGRYWLGELWPDGEYATWAANGNLRTGSGAGRFVRAARQNITESLPAGTTFFSAQRRSGETGSTALFSVGTSTSTFHHDYRNSQTGTLQPDGQEIADNYHFAIPSTADISRPFNTNRNNTSYNPSDFLGALYYEGTLSASSVATFFNHSDTSLQGSQLLKLRGTYGDDNAYIVVNGLDRTVANGSAFIGRWSFLTLIQSFLAAGLANDHAVAQLPRVVITQPNDLTDLTDPTTIDVQWTSEWKRWDGQKYTRNYANDFADGGTLSYVVMYSSDSGQTWRYADDRTPAQPGVRPPSGHMTNSTSFSWDVPTADFPSGSYIVMVEAYRDDRVLHYSNHKQKFFLKR